MPQLSTQQDRATEVQQIKIELRSICNRIEGIMNSDIRTMGKTRLDIATDHVENCIKSLDYVRVQDL